jgi:hypothetical protein
MGKVRRKEDSKGGLRFVALFEGAKGLLVLEQVIQLYESVVNRSTGKM